MTTVDIHAEMVALCEALRLPYHRTAQIIFRPDEVVATVFLENDNGKSYIDAETDEPAFAERRFKVRT